MSDRLACSRSLCRRSLFLNHCLNPFCVLVHTLLQGNVGRSIMLHETLVMTCHRRAIRTVTATACFKALGEGAVFARCTCITCTQLGLARIMHDLASVFARKSGIRTHRSFRFSEVYSNHIFHPLSVTDHTPHQGSLRRRRFVANTLFVTCHRTAPCSARATEVCTACFKTCRKSATAAVRRFHIASIALKFALFTHDPCMTRTISLPPVPGDMDSPKPGRTFGIILGAKATQSICSKEHGGHHEH